MPPAPPPSLSPPEVDWLLDPGPFAAGVYREAHPHEIVLHNGLVSRTWRLQPNGATVGYRNCMTSESILRSVRPEASVELDGCHYAIGGLVGLEEHAYLRPEWIDALTSDPTAFQLCDWRTGPTEAPFAWKRVRHAPDLPWPPPGVRLTLTYQPPAGRLSGLEATTCCELYDGIPLLCKWLSLRNGTGQRLRLDGFAAEILAAVEFDSLVESRDSLHLPALHVESDYGLCSIDPRHDRQTTQWRPDPLYTTQVNYTYQTRCLLESRPPRGPAVWLEPGETFTSFRTFELVFDSTDRERQGLAVRRMYRTVAPWTQENPILMHVRHAEPQAVKAAIDQCAAVGFEMVIMTFGSGFDPERDDPAYVAQVKELAEYAHARGIELGGYSLLASRRIEDAEEVVDAQTGQTGHAVFGHSPCLCSRWGQAYFDALTQFYAATGLDVLEHDGSYPGDLCAATTHPGHAGLDDSQWQQWRRISDFYRWCRGRGIYLNVPDWYFLAGSSKTAMGYREVNWSLPRERQILLARQNMYDGTWQKTPSMGWMFVPLVEYHGGGQAAALEPLGEHLDAYGAHLAQNFGWGVQACYRGPRLYDCEPTRRLVKQWVGFYKRYRAILESDVIHLRRPDGQDLDGVLHANPQLPERALLMVFNPLSVAVERVVSVPLYYAGLDREAWVREQEGPAQRYPLDRQHRVELPVTLPAGGQTWFVFAAAGPGGTFWMPPHLGAETAEGRSQACVR